MPIPTRLRPPPITDKEMAWYTELCRRIENRRHSDDDLAAWNRRAGTEYEEAEFRSYYGSMEIDDFVAIMLMGVPKLVPDLTYAELRDVLEAQLSATLSEAEVSYYLRWLEVNLPNADISDLLYWPDQWFRDETMLHVELSHDQILAYAMAKSGRSISGAPAEVPMPYPIPANS
jgi:hypothetical protein